MFFPRTSFPCPYTLLSLIEEGETFAGCRLVLGTELIVGSEDLVKEDSSLAIGGCWVGVLSD